MFARTDSQRPYWKQVQQIAAQKRAERTPEPPPEDPKPTELSQTIEYELDMGQFAQIYGENTFIFQLSTVRVTPMMAQVINEVAFEFGVTVQDIKGPARQKHIALARHCFCWRAYRECQRSMPEIGRFLNRDHTTVLNSIRRWEQRLQTSHE